MWLDVIINSVNTKLYDSKIVARWDKINRSGPRKEPWGTPKVTKVLSEISPFTTTCWERLLK